MALLIVPNLAHLHPGKTALIDPAFWTPEQLAIRGFETTTMGEINPRWVTTPPDFNPNAATVSSGEAQIRNERRTPFSWAGNVQAKGESALRMSFAYFPGWEVLIDGRPGAAEPSTPNGLINVTVPAGDHRVEVFWTRSTPRWIGEGISLASLAILAMVVLLRRGRGLAGDGSPGFGTG